MDVLIMAGILATTAILGLRDLGLHDLENDEATSFFIAQLDWGPLWESLKTSEANGSPFYISLHFWRTFGDSESTLRLLPWVFGILTPVLLYRLMKRLFGTGYGLAAGSLLCVNGFLLVHTQNLRSYSMSVFLATAATLLFVRWIEGAGLIDRIAYVVVGSLLVYAHFVGALVIGAHFLSLLLLPKEKWRLRDFALTYLAMAVLVLPLAVFVLSGDVGQVDWINELTPKRLYGGLKLLGGFDSSLQLFGYAGLALLGLIGVFWHKRSTGEVWKRALLYLWLLLPVIGVVLISLSKPLFQERYLLATLPAFTACAVLGIATLRFKVLCIAAWIGLLVITASQVPNLYEPGKEGKWAKGAEIMATVGDSSDALIFYAPTIIRPFGYYAGYYPGDTPSPVEPEVIYPTKDWLGFSKTRYTPSFKRILAEASTRDQVWLMTGAADDATRRRELKALVRKLTRLCGDIGEKYPEMALTRFVQCDRGPPVK